MTLRPKDFDSRRCGMSDLISHKALKEVRTNDD